MAKENTVMVIGYEEQQTIIKIIDKICTDQGVSRSSFMRKTIRGELARLSYLSDDQKKAFGAEIEVNAE